MTDLETETATDSEIARRFVAAWCAGDSATMRELMAQDLEHLEVNPSGVLHLRGADEIAGFLDSVASGLDELTTAHVTAQPVGDGFIRVDARMHFKRNGIPLAFDFAEYLRVSGGVVRQRFVACAGALRR